jgi:hypothetical protein
MQSPYKAPIDDGEAAGDVMQGWISIVAVSAVLSAGLVAGRAAADATATPAAPPSTATWSDPPARSAVTAPVAVERRTDARPAAACTAQAWAPLPSGCDVRGRPVRVIALTQR